jgi:hypothetical protein
MTERAQRELAPTGRGLVRGAGRVALWALVALIFILGIASIAAGATRPCACSRPDA